MVGVTPRNDKSHGVSSVFFSFAGTSSGHIQEYEAAKLGEMQMVSSFLQRYTIAQGCHNNSGNPVGPQIPRIFRTYSYLCIPHQRQFIGQTNRWPRLGQWQLACLPASVCVRLLHHCRNNSAVPPGHHVINNGTSSLGVGREYYAEILYMSDVYAPKITPRDSGPSSSRDRRRTLHVPRSIR